LNGPTILAALLNPHQTVEHYYSHPIEKAINKMLLTNLAVLRLTRT